MKIGPVINIIIIVVVLVMLPYFISIFYLFDSPQPSEKTNSNCLDIVENKLRDRRSLTLDFNEIVTCFEWDTMLVTANSLSKNYPDLEYTIIGNIHKGEELTNVNDWIDGSRNWSYIFFFKNKRPIPNAFIICQTELNLRNLRNVKFTRNKAHFEVCKGEADGRFRKLKMIK